MVIFRISVSLNLSKALDETVNNGRESLIIKELSHEFNLCLELLILDDMFVSLNLDKNKAMSFNCDFSTLRFLKEFLSYKIWRDKEVSFFPRF